MSFFGLLNKTCTIERPTASTNAAGETTNTWADSSTDVRCGIRPVRGESELSERGLELRATHKGYFLPGTDVRPQPAKTGHDARGDRILLESVYYHVATVTDPGGRGKHLEAELRREI